MGLYMMFGKYNPGAMRDVSPERTERAMALVERNGGKIVSGYALLGNTDLLLIVDFPETPQVVRTSLALGNLLGVSFTTAPAVTIEEFDRLAKEEG